MVASIAQYAANAGFTGADLLTAVAIAYAESSGKEDSYWPEADWFKKKGIPDAEAQGMGSYGLWQVFLWMHPEFKGWNLKDGQVNACCARLIFQKAGNSFSPWSTYTGNAYQTHLAQAQADIQALG